MKSGHFLEIVDLDLMKNESDLTKNHEISLKMGVFR